MRKLLALILAITFVFSSSVVNAASIGGKQPEQGKLAIGAEFNYIDRDMKNKTQGQKAELDSKQYLAKVEYGLLGSDAFNWSIFTKLGKADAKYKDPDDKYDFDEELVWGLGSKLVYKLEACKLGIEGQYFSIEDLETTKNLDAGDKLDAEWKEWQVSLFVAKDFSLEAITLTPYLGIKYSDLKNDTEWWDVSASKTTKYDVEEDDDVGVFVGTDINFTDNISVNLEGRFIDETAMSVGATYKF